MGKEDKTHINVVVIVRIILSHVGIIRRSDSQTCANHRLLGVRIPSIILNEIDRTQY